MWSSTTKANSSTHLAGERLTTYCEFSVPSAHLHAACPAWGSCVCSECTDIEALISVWHSLMIPLYRCACSQGAVRWGTPCASLGNSAKEVVVSSPLASPTCCDSHQRGASGSIASQTFSSKLVWTVLYEQGISLGPNPLPAWVIWHLPWSSYQVVGESRMYFFSGNSVSGVIQCCIPCKVKKGGVRCFWDLKRCLRCLACRGLVDTSFKQIGKNNLFYLVCLVVLNTSLPEAFKWLTRYLLETQVAEETPDINIYFSCQSLGISFCFLDTRACRGHLTINGSNLVVIGQPVCIGTYGLCQHLLCSLKVTAGIWLKTDRKEGEKCRKD